MPSGGKRQRVRVLDKRGGARANTGPPTKEAKAWLFSMWNKVGREYWEGELERGNMKAQFELFKRIHPELAKTIVEGDSDGEPIRIVLERPKFSPQEREED